jgi:pimeloyl-ACP methyl ester carboxylesterase
MARTEYLSLNANTRLELPGEFVKLSDGMTHYEISGTQGAPAVVLVHGFSVPYYIWDPIFPVLAKAGFRVLRYDIYGRGFSDRPHTLYNLDLFDRQLDELIHEIQLDLPVHLVGLSMGGPVVITYTDRHPNNVDRICLIDPRSEPMEPTGLNRLILSPFLGDFIVRVIGDRIFADQEGDLYHPEDFPNYQEKFIPQTRYRGFKRALLSTMRSLARTDLHPSFLNVGKQNRKGLLIWGREDQVLPFELHHKVRQMIPYLQLEPVDDAGHIPHYERPEVVNPLLINFLRQEV